MPFLPLRSYLLSKGFLCFHKILSASENVHFSHFFFFHLLHTDILFPAFPSFPPAANGDSLDWKDLSAPEITKRVTEKVQPGSIVLFHNAALHTPEALPGIIEYLLQNGYTFLPISQIILDGDYTIDHTGRQCPVTKS